MTKDDYYEHHVWSYSSAKHLTGPYPEKRKAVESLLGLGAGSSSMSLGTAVHSLVLDENPKVFSAQSLGFDAFRSNAAKAARDHELNSGGIALPNADYDAANRMAEAVKNHPVVKEHNLVGGKHEQSFYTTMDGIDIRFRPDIMTVDETDKSIVVADLKTVQDVVLYGGFEKAFEDYQYAYQAALYSMGVQDRFNMSQLPRFIFIAVDKNLTVGVYEVSRNTMNLGISMVRESVARIKEYGWEDTSEISKELYDELRAQEEQAERFRVKSRREILDAGITTI